MTLNRRFTPEFNWLPTFDALVKLHNTKPDSYSAALSNARQSLIFLDITLRRLESSYATYQVAMQNLQHILNSNTPPIFTERDRQILQQNEISVQEISLDYENFILHTKILMDKLCHLTKFLFPNQELPQTFTKHRKYFFKNTSTSFPKPYSEYMTKQTSWYALLLTPTRDHWIVHTKPSPFQFQGVQADASGVGIPFKMNVDSSKIIEHWPTLNQIRSHYPDKALQKETNFWEIIKLLRIMSLSYADEEELTTIIQKLGTTLPPLATLCEGVISYMNALLQAAVKNDSGVTAAIRIS